MTGRERLEFLARHLDGLAQRRALGFKPTRQFNMSVWLCQTSACAVGEACFLPEFNAEGLNWDAAEPCPAFNRGYRSWLGWRAVEEFFVLSQQEAFDLFAPSLYECPNEPAAVAIAIRQYLERTKCA